MVSPPTPRNNSFSSSPPSHPLPPHTPPPSSPPPPLHFSALDVVVGKGTSIQELFSGEDESLLGGKSIQMCKGVIDSTGKELFGEIGLRMKEFGRRN
ncbi:hypothetical protein L6452_09287 [Arctium lappa]|uniref:Uncharacterized protein n=1 Tax=Arctium lappa TaxID=4217 RepID=A0ACB9DK85_ARCLA|nr:hypothetical protein L6452_09287 [Arctium lappa]